MTGKEKGQDTMTTLLKGFGFTTRVAKELTHQARSNDLTLADVNYWLNETRRSTSLYNPLGFVRSRIRAGERPPTPASRIAVLTARNRYQGWGICSSCQTWPCLCSWDPDQETLIQFRTRTSLRYDGGQTND